MQITLKHGIKVGDNVEHRITLRRLTVADIMDAEMASERAVNTPAGVMLLLSDAKMGYELICRSVEKIGDFDCSMTMKQLRALSEDDFKLLKNGYFAINESTSEAGLSKEGR